LGFPFAANILYLERETRNGKRVNGESGSKLPHSEGAFRAQKPYGITHLRRLATKPREKCGLGSFDCI